MGDYDNEKWFELYAVALLELERAAMTGRIGAARIEIALRLEKLKQHPALDKEEYYSIQDALSNLRVLERDEARLAEDEKKRLLQEAARNLQTLAPKLLEPKPRENSPES